jgi:ABC-2 type transport system permease protein
VKKVFIIAWWEFIEKVRTKSFVISLILTPLIVVAFTLIPHLLTDEEVDNTAAIGVIDSTERFFAGLSSSLGEYTINNNQPAYIAVNLYDRNTNFAELKKRADSLLIKGTIEGLLIVTYSEGAYQLEYRNMSAGNIKHAKRFETAFNQVRIRNNLIASGVDPQIAEDVIRNIEIKSITLDSSGRESRSGFLEVFYISLIFIMILVFIILSSGGMLIRSLVEEKSNRLIEILVSSCKPEELLTGKMLGLSLLALVQIVIWALLTFALSGFRLIPDIAAANTLIMLVYFILGFFFYTALFVGIGSVVNTEQEAQQLTGYLTLVLLLPIIFSVSTIQNPDSSIVKVLTYIPFTTPAIMLLKFNIRPVPLPEIFLTISTMLFSIAIVILITAKIFSAGILSYGKMPKLKEIFHWLKEK